MDLARRIVQCIVATEFLDDGILEFRNAVYGGVFRLTTADGVDRRFLDVVRRIEIRLAGAKANHVHTLGTKITRLLRDSQGRRGFHTRERFGRLESHDGIPELDVWDCDRTRCQHEGNPSVADVSQSLERTTLAKLQGHTDLCADAALGAA